MENKYIYGIIILFLLFIMYFIFGGAKKKTGGGGGVDVPTTQCPIVVSQETGSNNQCPYSPYTYCSADTIEKIYIVESCPSSKKLIDKLISENKLTGQDDPKIIRCCKNPDLCPGIRSYPSVTCNSDPLTVYEGYCE